MGIFRLKMDHMAMEVLRFCVRNQAQVDGIVDEEVHLGIVEDNLVQH